MTELHSKDLFELYEDAGIFFLRSISRHLNWQLTAQDIWELAAIANGGGFTAFVNTVERARLHGRFPWNEITEARPATSQLPADLEPSEAPVALPGDH